MKRQFKSLRFQKIWRFVSFIISSFAFFSSGCASIHNHTIDFNPHESIRVAVLPFVTVDSNGEITKEESRLLLDNLSLISSPLPETPSQIVRKQVLAELAKSNLDLVSQALIDIDLPHHGFAQADGSIDIKKIILSDPEDMCFHFLTCDAILYGKITRWSRSYYGIESVNTVGIELKLVGAKDRKILFSSSYQDSETRGLTKGPTGISSLVLEPIRGLDSDIIVSLSQNIVKKMLQPLIASDTRPDFLNSGPPSIYAVSHDASNGQVKRNQPLVVVMFGSDGQLASFSIGKSVERIPMIERSPGHYYGEYIPLEMDSFVNEPVDILLTDQYGRTTTERVARKTLSLQPRV